MFASLLIANRGEIARRIVRTARRMGIRTIAVATEADRSWPHWREADEAVLIGEGPAADSYLSIERIITTARKTGAEAIHPGYGFLSENADFADACAAAGIAFIGPPASAIRAMGSKAEAKAIMARAGVPVVPGYGGERQEAAFLRQKAYEIGYPVLIKAVAGGGGRGMRRVDRALDFEAGLAAAKREALSAFGDDRVLVERYVETPRHIEVQVFADKHGNVIHLFERDCSVQRRHQKVFEEAPAPGLSDQVRQEMGTAAVRAAAAVGYQGAGTVEFIADASRGLVPGGFFFMEMNTRLQVEHPVTELVTGLDLVEWQLNVAAGEKLPLRQEDVTLRGHAIEARVYAEDPAAEFRPSTGRLYAASFPSGPGIRVDAGVVEGSIVTPYYDSMLAKVIATGDDRPEALSRLAAALDSVRLAGPRTNLAFLSAVAAHPAFIAGGVDTGFVAREMGVLAATGLEPGFAAAAIAEWLRHASRHGGAATAGPWGRTDGFEIGGVRRSSDLKVDVNGGALTAEVVWSAAGPEVVSIGGFPAATLRGGEILWNGAEAFVLYKGDQLQVVFPDPLARDLEAEVVGGEVTVPMPGKIVAVQAVTGMSVRKGDVLFSLEAMKMEHSVLAPIDGIVREVGIAAGQQVEQGTPALRIEAADDSARAPVE